MADGLESIIVSYQLDMADAKQQLQDFNAALTSTSETGDDVRDSIRNIGNEAQQAFSASAMNSAIRGMEDYAKSVQGAKEQIDDAAGSLRALQASGDAFKSISSGIDAALKSGKLFKEQTDGLSGSLKTVKETMELLNTAVETGTRVKKALTEAETSWGIASAAATAAATGGITLLITGIVSAISWISNLIDKEDERKEKEEEINDQYERQIKQLEHRERLLAAQGKDTTEVEEKIIDTKTKRLKDLNELIAKKLSDGTGKNYSVDDFKDILDNPNSHKDLLSAPLPSDVSVSANSLLKEYGITDEDIKKFKDNLDDINELKNKSEENGNKQAKNRQQEVIDDWEFRKITVQKGSKDELDAYKHLVEEKNKLLEMDKSILPNHRKLLQQQNINDYKEYCAQIQKANEDANKKKQEQKKKDLTPVAPLDIQTGTVPNDIAPIEEPQKISSGGLNNLKKALDAEQKTAEEKLLNSMQKIEQEAGKMIQGITGIVNDAFAQVTKNLNLQFQYADAELEKWHTKSTLLAGDNAQKQAAIARIYAAQQTQLHQQQAIKEAEIKRKEAEYNKAAKLIEIVIQTAVNVVKAQGLLPPLNIEQTALAIATGAIEGAVVAAQPLPAIPKFAEGVIAYRGMGTTTSDSNIVAISTGESIIKANATKRYEAELDAIQNMQFESLVFDKYIMPFLKATGKTTAQANDYDDWLLRKDVRDGNRAIKKSAEYIVKGVSEAVKGNAYVSSRYHA